ncbi:D-alanyl-D-alanine carboxypeptidase [Paroceanicella profunda]|uniref:serine-type D-Ala-D-Ala carboxypeptidase n=1 Tax=Paroceanicella profunda TaxID=2579971 RepID=A0A5B8FWI3_9RHOB|nr:D-alanyl-D-alanine carboxypeptidase family protein [Paroceanicella profunda]QDL90752.1 D-alanyl-D-alanine carboxypeptidase [Paroceanicella profunda]
MRGLLAALAASGILLTSPASALDTSARAAYMLDFDTGAVLLSKNADVEMPPASMSKLMTLNMLFEALADGRLSLEDRFRVSEKAWQMGGSKMFLREGERVRIVDLIQGIIVQSGNDACVVVAEGLAGSEEAFAQRMTERAHELGMTESTFTNASGWPDPGQRMSAHDLVTLARRIITEFPQFYPYFSETQFEWNGVNQRNRNPLLFLNIGADGLKTGHTQEAGYGLVGSAVRGSQRIVFMITGLESVSKREEEAERLTSWAFREFSNRALFKKGETLADAQVWLGAQSRVPMVTGKDILATLPFGAGENVKISVVYDGPIPAPIAEGQEIGRLVIEAPGLEPVTEPLFAGRAVAEGGYITRMEVTAMNLVGRFIDMTGVKDMIGNDDAGPDTATPETEAAE